MKIDELTIEQLYTLHEVMTVGGLRDERREEARAKGVGQWSYTDPERHKPVELGDEDDFPTEEEEIVVPLRFSRRSA